jgi:aldose 1-epimerase
MTTSLQLHCGPLRCDLRPDLGGCMAGLWWGDVPVLRSTAGPALTSARLAGSYPLVPFSNRLAQAKLVWAGTSHPLVQNNATEPHAIHGVGWQRAWQVLDESDQFALLSYEHKADAAWPFAFDTSQAFRLSEGALELTLSMTNQSSTPAPAGLGWHPYFVKRANSHLQFAASGRWEMGADKLPTQRLPSPGLDTSCTALDVDHCFESWQGDAVLADDLLRIRVASSLKRLVVYTHPTRDYVAIEPVSHVNNAVNLMATGRFTADELGLRVLQPGESMSEVMSIRVEGAV